MQTVFTFHDTIKTILSIHKYSYLNDMHKRLDLIIFFLQFFVDIQKI